MPSLSTFFKKRRSLHSPPAEAKDDSEDGPRGVLGHTHGSGSEAAATLRGAEQEAPARLADSHDDQTMAASSVATGPRRHSAAPSTGTGPGPGAGRLSRYVSAHDPVRRFRSRSTQFRLSGGGADGDGEAKTRTRTRTRLSWPARRSTSESPDVPESGRAQAQTKAQAPQGATDGRPLMREGVSMRESSLAALERPLVATPAVGHNVVQEKQNQQDKQEETRENSDGGRADNVNVPHSSNLSTSLGTGRSGGGDGGGGGNKLQKLKRLPSLSLKRGFSRRTSTVTSKNSSPPNSAGGPGASSHPARQTSQSPSAHHDKPLPPTPPPETQHRASPADPSTGPAPGPKSPLRLKRIMATLSSLDIEKLFSGAPQYFDRSEGHFAGAPHPSVAFPWDDGLAIRDLTDHIQIEDQAWGCITAWPHITRDVRRGPSASASRKIAEKRRAHFYPRCRERPSMLSMQGLEKGTMGFQAALELGVSDALQEEQWGFGSLGSKDRVIVDARKSLIASKEGLRRLDETAVLDHLMKNAERYQQNHQRDRNSCHELYKELFTQILHPPNRTFTDPYSLSVQVLHLVRVLAKPNVWIDFSRVEWRIRLGQILWGTADDDGEDSVSDGASITDAEDNKGLHEERYWLLLQILLACELLVRLDTITEGDEIPENVKPSEIHRFERDANPAVKWSLHLARAWLENIDITKAEASANGEHENLRGWLANLTNKMALTSDRPHSRHHERHQDHHKPSPMYVMRGRYWDRQVRGLTHFARRLKWPDIETQSTVIAENCRAVTEGTPLNTPFETPFSTFSAKSKDSSYFALNNGSPGRKQSRRQKVGAALHPSGWLSKSYVSGLMLPGEGIYHFIMSTLLENDIGAIHKLGPMANLCGGFVYSGKSFWSTACIVGRVLAAGHGAVECMGWISSDIIPHGLGDGWVNINAEDIPEDVKKTGKQARIWGKLAVERESSVLGGSDRDSVLPADFIIPFENNYSTPPPTISVVFKSLKLTETMDSVQTTPRFEVATPFSYESVVPEIKDYTPSLTFNVTTWEDDEDQEHTFNVVKDVYFVTAHPCVPSHHVKILKSPSSPTIQQIDLTEQQVPGNNRSLGHTKITCHPLHKYYTFTSIHLSELLAKPNWTLNQLLADPTTSNSPSITPSSASARPPRVLVIDAITNFVSQPEAHEIPLSPVTSRTSTSMSESSQQPSLSEDLDSKSPFPFRRTGTDLDQKDDGAAEYQMHNETRRRQFGSDVEILVRAICAERGWSAIISRRRRGCLACAIREAGALGWRVIIRVD